MHAGYYIAILSFILVAGAVYVSSWNENQRLAAIESNHPPVVNITREGDGVRIRWYGGWDTSFIDHIRVTCKNTTPIYKDYVKPKPGHYIYYPFVPPNSTITVLAYDKAVQSYREITNTTI